MRRESVQAIPLLLAARVLALARVQATEGEDSPNDEVLTMPDAGRRVRLGELYDARTDTVISGLLWKPSIINKHRYLTRAMYTQVDFARDDSIRSKKSIMGISADIALKAQMGITKLNLMTSFRFMTSKRSSEKSIRMTTSFRTRTIRESIDIANTEVLMNVNPFFLGGDPCPPGDEEKCKRATHVVSGVVWGADVYALFESIYKDKYDYMKLDAYMSMKLGMPMKDFTLEAGFGMEQEEYEMSNRTRVNIYGDLKMQQELPTTPDEALDFMRRIPEHSETLIGDGVPMDLVLTPLTWLKSDAAQLKQRISADTLERLIDIYEDLDTSEARILDLLGVDYAGFRGWKEDADAYYKGFESFRSNFSKMLSDALSSFQGGAISLDALIGVETFYQESEYYAPRVANQVETRRDNIKNLMALVSQFDEAQVTFAEHLSDFFAPTFDSRCDRVYALMLVGYRPSSDRASITKIREFVQLAKARLIKKADPPHPMIKHCLERKKAGGSGDEAECVEQQCYVAIHFDSYCMDFCSPSFCSINSVGGQTCPTTSSEMPPCELDADSARMMPCRVNNHTGQCRKDLDPSHPHHISNNRQPLSDCWCSCPRTQVLEYYKSQAAARLTEDMPRVPWKPVIMGVTGHDEAEQVADKQVALLHIDPTFEDGARNYRVTILWDVAKVEGDSVTYEVEQRVVDTSGRRAVIPLRNLIAGREYTVEVQGLSSEGAGPPAKYGRSFMAAWRMATVTFQGVGNYQPLHNEGPDWSSERIHVRLSLPALDSIAHVSLHSTFAQATDVDTLLASADDESKVAECEQYDRAGSVTVIECVMPLHELPRSNAPDSPRQFELRVWDATKLLAAKSAIKLHAPSSKTCPAFGGDNLFCPQSGACVPTCSHCEAGSSDQNGECLDVSCPPEQIRCPAKGTCLVKGTNPESVCNADCRDDPGGFGLGADVVEVDGEMMCVNRCNISLPEEYTSTRAAQDLVPRGESFNITCADPYFIFSGAALTFTCPAVDAITKKADVDFVFNAAAIAAKLGVSLPECRKCPSDKIWDADLGSCRYAKGVGAGWNYVTGGDFRTPPSGQGKPGRPFETLPANPTMSQMQYESPGVGGSSDYSLRLRADNAVVCLRQRLPMNPMVRRSADIIDIPNVDSIWRASVAYQLLDGGGAKLCLRDRNSDQDATCEDLDVDVTRHPIVRGQWRKAETQIKVSAGADRLEVDVCAAGYAPGSGDVRIDHLAVHAFEGHVEAVPSLADMSAPMSGMVAYFKTSCPPGWIQESATDGRVVVGVSEADAAHAGHQEGVALGPRSTRSITEVPSHRHSVTSNPGTSEQGNHSHMFEGRWDGTGLRYWFSGAHDQPMGVRFAPPWQLATSTNGGHRHAVDDFNTDSTGQSSVDVTMPYVHLVACRYVGIFAS